MGSNGSKNGEFFCFSKFRLQEKILVRLASWTQRLQDLVEYSLDPFPPRDSIFPCLCLFLSFVIRHRHCYKPVVLEYVHEVEAVTKGILEAKSTTTSVGAGQAVKSH